MPLSYDEETKEEKEPPAARTVVRSGWEGVDNVTPVSTNYAQRLKVGADPVVVKFLESAPYASWNRHWITRSGKMSFVCIGGPDDSGDCPLCNMGDRSRPMHALNVVLMSRGELPVIRSYEAGTRVIASLRNFNDSEQQGPLDKHYWAVSRSGQGPQTQYNHLMVKDRDLSEDWGVNPLTDSDLADFREDMYTSDIIENPTKEELMEIVKETTGIR